MIDTGFVAESFLPELALDEEPMTIGGIEMISVNRYDTAHQSVRHRHDLPARLRGASRHVGAARLHLGRDRPHGRQCAAIADVEMYGGVDGSPYSGASSRLLLVRAGRHRLDNVT